MNTTAAEPIRVVIVDDIAETRDHLAKLLSFEPDMAVTGSVGSGQEALNLATQTPVDVLLLDINMPGMDGLATAEQLSLRVPTAAIIMMSVQGEPDYLRRAMLAGAREFLVKPFSSDELAASIRQVNQRERQKLDRVASTRPAAAPTNGHAQPAAQATHNGQVVTFFSPKGGVGRTTLAVNFAVAAKTELGKKVALVDGGLQFGDVGVLLNLNPKNQTIADVAREMASGDLETLDSTLIDHSTGVRVLMAPPSPEMAELVTPDHVSKIIAALRQTHDLVVVDCSPLLQDVTLAFLDQSDVVLTVLTLEITNIKNIRQFLALVEQLGYPEGKVQLLLNRADSGYGIRLHDVESSIGRKISHSVVSDGRTVVYALNRGVPFVVAARSTRVSDDIVRLAKTVVGGEQVQPGQAPTTAAQRKSGGLFQWRAH
jgi:pilus assembly protein CpaE